MGICSFLVCNYALLLVNAEMLGFNDPNLEVRRIETKDVDAISPKRIFVNMQQLDVEHAKSMQKCLASTTPNLEVKGFNETIDVDANSNRFTVYAINASM